MSTLELVELILIAVIIIGLAIFYLIKAIKNHWLEKISDEIVIAMKDAEASGKTGKEKKEYVLQRIQELCSQLGVPYSFIKKLIDMFIEKTIKAYNNISK